MALHQSHNFVLILSSAYNFSIIAWPVTRLYPSLQLWALVPVPAKPLHSQQLQPTDTQVSPVLLLVKGQRGVGKLYRDEQPSCHKNMAGGGAPLQCHPLDGAFMTT